MLFPFSSNFHRYRYVIVSVLQRDGRPGRAVAGGGCGDGSDQRQQAPADAVMVVAASLGFGPVRPLVRVVRAVVWTADRWSWQVVMLSVTMAATDGTSRVWAGICTLLWVMECCLSVVGRTGEGQRSEVGMEDGG